MNSQGKRILIPFLTLPLLDPLLPPDELSLKCLLLFLGLTLLLQTGDTLGPRSRVDLSGFRSGEVLMLGSLLFEGHG